MLKLKSSANRYLVILQYLFFISAILYFGRTLFVPLSFALLISCILYPICGWLERHRFSRMAAIAVSISALTILFGLVVLLLVFQFSSFLTEWPTLEPKLAEAIATASEWLTDSLNIQRTKQEAWLNQALNSSGAGIMTFIKNTIAASAVGSVLFILIPVYSVMILFYRNKWMEVLYRIFPQEGRDRIREIVKLSIQSYYSFIKGMALVYLIVGILNSLGLWLLGIPHPFLFGFIASILTFIPYVGILVASLLPVSFAWITYSSIWYPLGVIGVFAIVQYLEANLIFPLAVSSKLKLNALVTILAIVAGGLLWGVSGMILFIPFLGILKLIADRSPDLKTLAIILGG
ncbi:MAG: permease [Bacteroidetes bacterium OLB12]|nr:MAG: permease [Bacteroidetes bacterium OLB12]HNR72672.1 AI-2E family transporter [Cyclobacteriaceae bacterium]HNU40947.1 AI-2E family transporter [Cyclobacteriaceae bacterium]